jgi:hypothetical protein
MPEVESPNQLAAVESTNKEVFVEDCANWEGAMMLSQLRHTLPGRAFS